MSARRDQDRIVRLAERLVAWLRVNGFVGKNRPVRQSIVAGELGVETRDVQYAMGALPGKELVASSCGNPMGVFLCQTVADAADYERQLDNRIRNLAVRLRHVRRWMRSHREIEARSLRPPTQRDGQLLFQAVG